jgi:TolA-binding protein
VGLSNGQTDLARQKLQEILDHYPNSPAADEAKKLVAQINGQ